MTSAPDVRNAGFGWITFILIALFLFLALGKIFFDGQATTGDVLGRAMTKSQLTADGSLIIQRISGCALQYPTSTGTGAYASYPDEPATEAVSDLVCPGSGASLWSGSDGVYYPPAPTGFSEWSYHHASDGIWVETVSQDDAEELIDSVVAEFGNAATQPTPGTLRLYVRGN